MDTDLAISVEGVSKCYYIGARPQPTLRDAVEGLFGRVGGREEFWALKNVDLALRKGEIMGLLGSNGAGKSTLLKILSRVTEPTAGRVAIRGRLGSLLEVGTGFHPDLSGRENVYLNGAIIGMRRSEIDRKFEDIVRFSEIERFIDVPVKRYSSGMYVRLAFAVAANLNPEIILIDEVLSVGDAAFQRKCFDKVNETIRMGGSAIVVSHNLGLIRTLCPESVLLRNGTVAAKGSTEDVLREYLESGRAETELATVVTRDLRRPPNVPEDTPLRITSVVLHSATRAPIVDSEAPLAVTMVFECSRAIRSCGFGFYVETLNGERLIETRSAGSISPVTIGAPGSYAITARFAVNPLGPGEYLLGVGARDESQSLDWLPGVLRFSVEEGRKYYSEWFEKTSGRIRLPAEWEHPKPVA